MADPKYLKRYLRVQRDEMPALFKITERIPVQFDSETKLDELREIHKEGIVEYRKLRESLETEAMEAFTYKIRLTG